MCVWWMIQAGAHLHPLVAGLASASRDSKGGRCFQLSLRSVSLLQDHTLAEEAKLQSETRRPHRRLRQKQKCSLRRRSHLPKRHHAVTEMDVFQPNQPVTALQHLYLEGGCRIFTHVSRFEEKGPMLRSPDDVLTSVSGGPGTCGGRAVAVY